MLLFDGLKCFLLVIRMDECFLVCCWMRLEFDKMCWIYVFVLYNV